MNNDTIFASVSLGCSTCTTTSFVTDVVIYSERTAHFNCKTCRNEILQITFRFEKTNRGIYLEKRPAWENEYSKVICLNPKALLISTFHTTAGNVKINISGDQ